MLLKCNKKISLFPSFITLFCDFNEEVKKFLLLEEMSAQQKKISSRTKDEFHSFSRRLFHGSNIVARSTISLMSFMRILSSDGDDHDNDSKDDCKMLSH